MKSCKWTALFKAILLVLMVLYPYSANAQTEDTSYSDLEKRLDDQEDVITHQQKMLDEQARQIKDQQLQLQHLIQAEKINQKKLEIATQTISNTNKPSHQPQPQLQPVQMQTQAAPQQKPIEVQTEEQKRPQVEVLADQGGILSPKGMLTYENSLEYTNTTRNLFTFNGVQLAQVVLVGAVNNNNVEHQVAQYSGRLRLGITNRLEADVHVPYVYRNDQITGATTGTTTQTSVQGYDLGDIDAGLSYQLNQGHGGWPFLIGNLRYKANNADGPYDVPYDANNIALRLPTGTGFQTVEGSITAIKVNDPAVLFANLGYVYDVPRDVDRNFGNTRVTNVSPGDAINALAGIGFAINQDTSFSLGYKHSYVFPTTQHSVDLSSGMPFTNTSNSSQVGALVLGLNYALSPKTSLNFNIEAGVTNDAPDIHLVLRIPFQLGSIF